MSFYPIIQLEIPDNFVQPAVCFLAQTGGICPPQIHPKPKAPFNYNSSLHLYTQSLQSLDVTDVFNSRLANLTGFATLAPQNLFVSSFIHKSFVEVNEEGTEAAAVTVGIVQLTSFIPRTLFHCNRPFIFFIMDNENKNLLFMGAYMRPKTE